MQLDVHLQLWFALGILLKLDLPHEYFLSKFCPTKYQRRSRHVSFVLLMKPEFSSYVPMNPYVRESIFYLFTMPYWWKSATYYFLLLFCKIRSVKIHPIRQKSEEKRAWGGTLTTKRTDLVNFSKLFGNLTHKIYHSKCGLQMMTKNQLCAWKDHDSIFNHLPLFHADVIYELFHFFFLDTTAESRPEVDLDFKKTYLEMDLWHSHWRQQTVR